MRTRPIPTLAVAGPLATLATLAALLPCAASAAPAPLAAEGIPVDPARSVTGHFDATGTQAWRLYLRQGRYYALWGWNAERVDVAVSAAGGRQLAGFQMFSEAQPHGAGFRAPYTGLYTVAATCSPANAADCVGGSYVLRAARDCPGDLPTPCGIAVGQTIHAIPLGFFEDRDDFRARLKAGAYAVSVAFPDRRECDFGVDASVQDARGRPLAVAFLDCAAPTLSFTAPVDGTYLVAIGSDDNAVSTYDLALSRR
jgi:hypothetical protein